MPDILKPHLLYDRDALAREVAQQEPGLNDLQRLAYNSVTHALDTSLHTANDVTAGCTPKRADTPKFLLRLQPWCVWEDSS